MREYFSITRQAMGQLTQRGRRVLFMYFVAMVAIAGLDGIALFLLAKLLGPGFTSGDSNTVTNSNLMLLVIILALFVLRSALSTLVGWVSVKELAQQEVEIGQRRMESLNGAALETRLLLNESDFFTAVDRAPTTLINGYLIPVVNVCIEFITGLVVIGVVFNISARNRACCAYIFLSHCSTST